MADQTLGKYESFCGVLQHLSKVIIGIRPIVNHLKRAVPSELRSSRSLDERKRKFTRIYIVKSTKNLLTLCLRMISEDKAHLKVTTTKTTLDVCTDATLEHIGIANPNLSKGKVVGRTLPVADSWEAQNL